MCLYCINPKKPRELRWGENASNPLPFYLHCNEVMSCCLTFMLQLRFLLPHVIHCRESGFRKFSRAKRHESEEQVGGNGGLFPSYLFPSQVKKNCKSKSCFHQRAVIGNNKIFALGALSKVPQLRRRCQLTSRSWQEEVCVRQIKVKHLKANGLIVVWAHRFLPGFWIWCLKMWAQNSCH